MDTLMRTLKLLFVGVVLLMGFTAQAEAQDWNGRGFFHVSVGGQAQDQTFTDSATFTIYGDRGASAAGHSIGGGTLFDIAGGARVWRSLAFGLAFSANSNKNDAVVTVRVPHPIVFGQPREASITAADLEHSENAVHLQFSWILPLTEKIQVAFMAGPSFFTVRQDVAEPVTSPAQIRDVAPFTTVTINTINITEVKDSPVGVNIGVDGTYLVTPMIGVGAFVRYAGASVDLDTPAGVTRDEQPKAGGVQAAIGLRLRF
jgi:hypothetical protein